MGVDALQLRPRSPVALFDAALRVCATSSGVWALTLPGGAAVVAALAVLAEALRSHRPASAAVGLVTLAWLARAIAQGAACHHLEQALVGPAPPALWDSVQAALRRAPGLVTASVVMLALDVALWLVTLGLGLLFLGAHVAGFAAVMRGQGSALRVYGTSARLLGPARHAAGWVRACGLTQVVVALNLQLAVMASLFLAEAVLGLEVGFLRRFTAPDDPVWLAVVAACTFALFEPVRAACAALLLVDARVRREGLDLLAQVAQLPRRRTRGAPLALGLTLALLATPGEAGPGLERRLRALAQACELEDLPWRPLELLAPSDESALSRFVDRLEGLVEEEEDCESAGRELRAGLKLMAGSARPATGDDPAALARTALARPEFLEAPLEDTAPPPADEADGGWWEGLWRRLLAWLQDLAHQRSAREPLPTADPMPAAHLVLGAAGLGVLAVLAALLARAWRPRGRPPAPVRTLEAGRQVPLRSDAEGALTRLPEGWAELAQALAARGEFREAIRHLYLGLLAGLHRRGAITYQPTQSNWETLRAFRGPEAERQAFLELTRRFDLAWYGRLEAGSTGWERFRRAAAPLLARAEGADA